MLSFKKNIVIFVAIASFTKAQQASLFNTYSYDLMQLNIASIGRTCVEANINYRAQWVGIKEAPKLYQLNAAMALGDNNGVGIKVFQQSYGLLKLVNFTGGYAFRAQLTKTSKLHLGLGASYNQNRFDAASAIVLDNTDPALINSAKQRSNNFDCEAGAMYFSDKITAGISAYHIYNTNNSFQAVALKLKPQFNIIGAYKIKAGNNLTIEPWLVDRYTITGSNNLEGMLNFKFFQAITIAGGYRLNYGLMAMAGYELGKLRFAYSFDYANGKNVGSTHQVLLGMDLCKKKKQIVPDSTVAEVPKVPEVPVTPSVAAVEEKKVEEPAPVVETPKTETPTIIPEKAIQGVLSSDDPKINWTNKIVRLLNEKGEVVEETRTDSDGKFVFKHISGDKNYMIDIDDSDPSLKNGAKISMKTTGGKEMATWTKGAEKPNFKIISGDKNTLSDMEAEEVTFVAERSIEGILSSDNPYANWKNKTVKLLNDKGEVVDETKTNSHGAFVFKHIKGDQNYNVDIDDTDPNLRPGSKIFMKSINGKEMATWTKGAEKTNFKIISGDKNTLSDMEAEDVSLVMAMSGQLLDQNDQPIKYVHMIAKESDGSNPQKTISDITGHFHFKSLDAEKNYIFEIDENDKLLAGVTRIKIANSKGQVIKTSDVSAGKFTFKLLEAERNVLSTYKVEDVFVETLIQLKKKGAQPKAKEEEDEKVVDAYVPNPEINIPQESNLIAEKIVFEKASMNLSAENRLKLKVIAKIIMAKTGHVTIVGYASSEGDGAFNNSLAEARAHIVHMALIGYGVKGSRLSEKNGGISETVNKEHDANRTVRFEE